MGIKVRRTIIKIVYILIFFIVISILFEGKQFLRRFKKVDINKLPKIKKEDGVHFAKCSHLAAHKNLKTIFDENDIKRIKNGNYANNKGWDIYLPCGYNYVEGELKDLKVTSDKQRIFAINGCDKIASKNNLWKILRDYYGRKKASTMMPETYIISDPEDMEIFKNNYRANKLYLLKKNMLVP